MIIEVTGVNFVNRGATLMLHAIAEHFAQFGPQVELAALPFGSFAERAEYRLLQKLPRFRPPRRPSAIWPRGRTWLAARAMPKAFRRDYGLIREAEIDAVVDASGFAYSDQWGLAASKALARRTSRWKAQGKRVVLLPQAFGPFTGEPIRAAIRQALEHVDLAFARDRKSYDALGELAGDAERIQRGPDFTNLVSAEQSVLAAQNDDEPSKPTACIVPNLRMVDKTEPSQRQRYLDFLATCVEELTRRELEPVVVIFNLGADEELVPLLQEKVGRELRQLPDRGVASLKAELGRARVIVGSRFHALICGLCQGVPCLGTGWSHKYRALFEDYGCPEMLCTADATPEEIRAAFDRALGEPGRSTLVAQLHGAAESQRQAARGMWNDVDRLLGLSEADTCT